VENGGGAKKWRILSKEEGHRWDVGAAVVEGLEGEEGDVTATSQFLSQSDEARERGTATMSTE
jgi:hypothetical protein